MTSPADLAVVAEDESIIAMAIQDELEDAGYAGRGPFRRRAPPSFDGSTPARRIFGGVLHTNLRDRSSRALALEPAHQAPRLRRRHLGPPGRP